MAVVLCFSVVSLCLLGIGVIFPKKYTSSITIHGDSQNIIAPLLQGQAEVTRVIDRVKVVRETVYSQRLLEKALRETDVITSEDSPKEVELILNNVRKHLVAKSIGSGFIKVSYQASTPSEAYEVVNKVTDLFIQDASESKRNESRDAFMFIDKQVKTYKEQLKKSEEKLKAFKSNNLDGTEEQAKARISQLRQEIEEMKLDLDDARTKVRDLKTQLNTESEYVSKRFKTDVYRERLEEAMARLDTLKLSFKETYPDVVELKHQIADLEKAILDTEKKDFSPSASGRLGTETSVNPLYEELRTRLSEAEISQNTKKRRLVSLERLLEEEYARLRRIAERQAELAELTRDYTVTKDIYEEMLERKEKARLSMALDIEGQGVNYKIQEPAVYPLNPTGLRFLHFVLIGPVLGVLVPIGFLIALVQFDPRIRFVEKLEENLTIPVLGVVPHIHTRLSKRVLNMDIILLGFFLLVVIAAYITVVVLRVKGII